MTRLRARQLDRTQTFEQFYESNVDQLYGFLRIRSSAALAEELTAEVFVSAFERWTDESPLTTGWLFTVARRRLVDEWRTCARIDKRFQRLVPTAQTTCPDRSSESEARVTVLTVLDELPKPYRQALILRYVDDLSLGDVAEVLERSKQATESLLARARRTFATLYKAADVVDDHSPVGRQHSRGLAVSR